MVHFGIICPAAPSHLNFMTTIGYELKQRGHRVTMVNAPEAQHKAEMAGLEFALIESVEFSAGVIDQKLARLGKYRGWSAMKATTEWIPTWVDTLLNQAPTVLKERSIEALVIDQTSFEGGTIADIIGIPFVNICNITLHQHYSTPPYWTPWRHRPEWWANWRNRIGYLRINALKWKTWQVITKYRKAHRLPVLCWPNEAFSKVACLSQLPAEFDFPRTDLPDCFYYTGPFHNPIIREPIPFPYEKLTGQPLIYASLGTLQNQLVNIFQCIAAACATLDVQLVLSLGGALSAQDLPKLPGSPIVVDFAPQLELLQRARLTITHAGMNTTLESLTQGVPMVAIPITNDQPGVAARIVWSGTGEVVAVHQLNVKRLRRAIEQVLYQPSYKANAVKLQQAIKCSGRTALAVEIIEREISKAMGHQKSRIKSNIL